MKSPVRENRTPGSVRGLSGNWQSYRDQLFPVTTGRNAQFLETNEIGLNVSHTDSFMHGCLI